MKDKNWDSIKSNSTAKSLLDEAENEIECVCLLVEMDKHSGAWLQAPSILNITKQKLEFPVLTYLGHFIPSPPFQ